MANLENPIVMEKLNEKLNDVMKEWWNTLTKPELLAFISQYEDITADDLRKLFANEDCKFYYHSRFQTTDSALQINFNQPLE